ncbi:tetratricopeptide repeat protein [Candidatus Binatus sp.]|uniref:tetratricopeptide repeat protein n=1 Tax=Candidatus Binatus sp. TaxID=2811406 RepID=UPI003CC54F0E
MKPGKQKDRAIAGTVGLAALLLISFLSVREAKAQSPTIDRDILLLQRILKQRPDPDLYYRLGDLYVQKGRQTGDITYFNLGGNSLREALKLQPDLAPAHRHLAFVLYSLHDFAGATAEAHQAIKLDPNDSYAYGVLGDAQFETGEYPEAADTYSRMVAINGDLYSYSRRSGLETIQGESDLAVADLNRAIDAGIRAGEPPEAVAWAQYTLAQDFFLLGRLDDANRLGEASLKTFPNYHRALAILGQVSAAKLKLDRSADFYRRAIAVIPLPEYAVALADVYTKMGRQRDAELQRKLVEFIARLSVLNRVLYNRVLVDYYADHDINHKQAVELAAGEYAIRKDIYGEDALAWALYRDGQAAKALPHIVAALRFRTADARLYFHAGMIYKAVGQTNEARSNLKQALAINSHFQPLLDEVAASEYTALNKRHAKQYAEVNADARR